MSTHSSPDHVLKRRARLAVTALSLVWIGASAVQAQASWVKQAPNPTGDFFSVAVLSATEMWAAGTPSTLAHTTDGGATWASTTLPSSSTNAVFFRDAQHGWVAGNAFFHTTDSGATWSHDADLGSVYGLQFLTNQVGWACGNGGTVYKTTDGGATWGAVHAGGIATMRGISFVNALRGWVADIDGNIFRSTDGGATWALQAATGASNLGSVQFFDQFTGWVMGGSSFLRTTDGGATWSRASLPAGTWAQGARFLDPLHAWAVGEGGNAVCTTDGGATWATLQPAGGGPRLWSVGFTDASTGYFCGEASTLSKSTDGGLTWAQIQSGGHGAAHGLDAVDASRAWGATDGGEVMRTTDGGHMWFRSLVAGFDVYGRMLDVDFVDASLGYAVGQVNYFGGSEGRVVRSTDGGATWATQLALPILSMTRVAALGAGTVIAIGDDSPRGGHVYRSTDGGATWADVSPSLALIGDIDFPTATTGWIAGGLIFRSTDAGLTWTQQMAPPSFLYGVSFANAQVGWAVGEFGTLLHTTDGGTTWATQNAGGGSSVDLMAVDAIDANTAWIGGESAFAARTTDGGATWTREDVTTESPVVFEAAAFIDGETGWLSGYGGTWLRTGITGVGADHPPTALPSRPSIWASPNPARGEQALVLWSPARARELSVTIYSLDGRRVRALHARTDADGGAHLTWDGTDTQGHRVAAGLYVAVTSTGREEARAKLVRQ